MDVREVETVFDKTVELGCIPLQKPKKKTGDPDRKGMFPDFAGNIRAIGTQLHDG